MKLRIIVAALVATAAFIAAFGAAEARATVSPATGVLCNSLLGTVGPYASGSSGADFYGYVMTNNGGVYYINMTVDPTESPAEPGLPDEDPWNDDDVSFSPGANRTLVTVTSGACGTTPPPPPVGIFLCYSAFQDQPGVWPKDVAEQLLQQGYWLPYAVSGDVAGGTNLGGYHLTCNIAATQSVSDSFVGGDGTLLGPGYAGTTVGLYPKVGG